MRKGETLQAGANDRKNDLSLRHRFLLLAAVSLRA